ncbi:MAG: hypothetical protein HC888_15480 [Candidatus Competibacteraceae bacterium]|nr:hypothetical protein [Candidatus Competibacteraceae bacterium]
MQYYLWPASLDFSGTWVSSVSWQATLGSCICSPSFHVWQFFCVYDFGRSLRSSFYSFLANAAAFLQFYLPQAHPSGISSHLSLLQVNAWGPKNSHHKEVLELIKEKSPDVVGVSEITETWVRVLSEGLPDYKYKVIENDSEGYRCLAERQYRIHASLLWSNKATSH